MLNYAGILWDDGEDQQHTELPRIDHAQELDEPMIWKALKFFTGQSLENLLIATSADLTPAWGAVDPEDLDAMRIVALETDDKDALEALEAKKEKQRKREAAKKKLPSKSTSSILANIHAELQKRMQNNDPLPPPPNQLQGTSNSDNDVTPRKYEFE